MEAVWFVAVVVTALLALIGAGMVGIVFWAWWQELKKRYYDRRSFVYTLQEASDEIRTGYVRAKNGVSIFGPGSFASLADERTCLLWHKKKGLRLPGVRGLRVIRRGEGDGRYALSLVDDSSGWLNWLNFSQELNPGNKVGWEVIRQVLSAASCYQRRAYRSLRDAQFAEAVLLARRARQMMLAAGPELERVGLSAQTKEQLGFVSAVVERLAGERGVW